MIKLITAAALAVAALATPAFADGTASTVKVSYDGLDLATAAGKATLDRRIAHAVGQVCNVDNSVEMRSSVARCRSAAFAAARAQQTVAIAQAGGSSSLVIASR